MPISPMDAGLSAVPAPMVVAGYGASGYAAPGPIAGVGGTPVWGYADHAARRSVCPDLRLCRFGAPASLQSFTMRNLTGKHRRIRSTTC